MTASLDTKPHPVLVDSSGRDFSPKMIRGRRGIINQSKRADRASIAALRTIAGTRFSLADAWELLKQGAIG